MITPKTIYLVDDDTDDQVSFKECIEEIHNASLFGIANDGREAMDTLEKCVTLPDMIFMDINMPHMDGIECLTKIKMNKNLRNIPVVMLSTDIGQAQLTKSLGANAFIKKPTNCDSLKIKVEQMINLDFTTESKFANHTFHTTGHSS